MLITHRIFQDVLDHMYRVVSSLIINYYFVSLVAPVSFFCHVDDGYIIMSLIITMLNDTLTHIVLQSISKLN